MGRYLDGQAGSPPSGLSFRINGAVLSNQSVYNWHNLGQNRRFLVYTVAISLRAGDVVTLAVIKNGTAAYGEFSGYYLGPADQNTRAPTTMPTKLPTTVSPAEFHDTKGDKHS